MVNTDGVCVADAMLPSIIMLDIVAKYTHTYSPLTCTDVTLRRGTKKNNEKKMLMLRHFSQYTSQRKKKFNLKCILNIFYIKENKHGTPYVITEEIPYLITISILRIFIIYITKKYTFDHNE